MWVIESLALLAVVILGGGAYVAGIGGTAVDAPDRFTSLSGILDAMPAGHHPTDGYWTPDKQSAANQWLGTIEGRPVEFVIFPGDKFRADDENRVDAYSAVTRSYGRDYHWMLGIEFRSSEDKQAAINSAYQDGWTIKGTVGVAMIMPDAQDPVFGEGADDQIIMTIENARFKQPAP